MKKILMITPFFAPYSHAAVYRAHRFAKYLPRFEWKPYVLTVDRSFLYFIDKSLLDDLPKEVEIMRARHIDLTYSGLKSLFEKPLTDNGLIKGPTPSDLTAKLQKGEKRNFIKVMTEKIRNGFIFLPDRYVTWYPFALKMAREIIKSQHIDALYSTAPPFIPHLIAMKLKSRFNIPWLADFRDPGVEEKRAEFYSSQFKLRINCMIEKKIMKKADFIVTTCEEAKNLFLSKYKEISNNKIVCIGHSTDTEILKLVKPRVKSNKCEIIFLGEFQKEYHSRKFFEFLKVIFERKLFEKDNVEVLIIGSIKRNTLLKNEVEFLGLSDVVKFVDHLPPKDYFSFLLSADATLLPGIPKYTIPIKLPDYLFAKKPIIAFDVTDEVRNILKESGLGVIMPNDLDDGIKVLLDILKGNLKLNINEDYINQFTAFNQTKELSEILKKLIERS